MLAEHPDKVALSATTTWLPLSIQRWVTSMESAARDMEGRPFNPQTKPVLSGTDQKQLTQCLWMLDQAAAPARSNPTALVEAVRISLSEVPYRSKSSQDDWALTIKLWASKCEGHPLWAVQKAADWWACGARSGDQLGDFLTDVRLAVGNNVLGRRRMLARLNG